MSKKKGNRIDTGKKDSLKRPIYNWSTNNDKTVNSKLVSDGLKDFDYDDNRILEEFPGRIKQLYSLASELDDTGRDILKQYSGQIYLSLSKKNYDDIEEHLKDFEEDIISTGENSSWFDDEYDDYFKEKARKVRNKTGLSKIRQGNISFKQFKEDAENLQTVNNNKDNIVSDYGQHLVDEFVWGNNKQSYNNILEECENALNN